MKKLKIILCLVLIGVLISSGMIVSSLTKEPVKETKTLPIEYTQANVVSTSMATEETQNTVSQAGELISADLWDELDTPYDITSLGTLTSLDIDGDLDADGRVVADNFYAQGRGWFGKDLIAMGDLQCGDVRAGDTISSYGDLSTNSNLIVDKDASIGGNLDINGKYLYLGDDESGLYIYENNGRLDIGKGLFVGNDIISMGDIYAGDISAGDYLKGYGLEVKEGDIIVDGKKGISKTINIGECQLVFTKGILTSSTC